MIFSVRFAISVPRQNAHFLGRKFNIFKFATPKMPPMLKSTLSKPLHNITHTLGDSNMQGHNFRGNTLEYSIQNVHFLGHCEKKIQKLSKKNPFVFRALNQKLDSYKSFPNMLATFCMSQNFDFKS